jgi:hypothetical protein
MEPVVVSGLFGFGGGLASMKGLGRLKEDDWLKKRPQIRLSSFFEILSHHHLQREWA